MGFFSWKTSEGQSIANWHSSRPTFTVWLVLPDGTKYQEDCYDGYGEFGGKDFYEVVAGLNGHANAAADARSAGLDLSFKDDQTGVVLPRFTSDPDAKWEDLKDPEPCPDQGYFYDD